MPEIRNKKYRDGEGYTDPYLTMTEEERRSLDLRNRMGSGPYGDDREKRPPIGPDEIRKANQTLEEYRKGKAALTARIKANNEWWRLQNWVEIGKPKNQTDPTPSSAWLFNMLANKHADAMDNYPQPDVLPRAKDDEQAAKELSKIIPVILEQDDFEETYDRETWRKLINGAAVYGVFWDPNKDDIIVRGIDPLSIYWEPGVRDIQASRNVFTIEEAAADILEKAYPQLKGKLTGGALLTETVRESEQRDHTDKCNIVDWYYKKDGRLEYCKFVSELDAPEGILFSSENERARFEGNPSSPIPHEPRGASVRRGPRGALGMTENGPGWDGDPSSPFPEARQARSGDPGALGTTEGDPPATESGWYADGKYPYVFDVCYPLENTPFGFGPLDVAKEPQKYIDQLDSLALKNAQCGSRIRYFHREGSGINKEEFMDARNELVTVSGSLNEDNVKPIEFRPLDPIYSSIRAQKIDELKETTGNRDFSQGGTAAGVTSGSAIAALQEAGNKLSRDQNKSAYRAFKRICYLVIERIRQFYDAGKTFRIVGPDGNVDFTTFDSDLIAARPIENEFGEEFGDRVPVFDIVIKAQKSSPFSREIQNQRAQELFQMGLFNPQNADQAAAVIEMMEFEGKDRVLETVRRNGGMYQEIQQLMMQNQQLTAQPAALTGQAPPGGAAPEVDGTSVSSGSRIPTPSKSESEAAERIFNGGAIARANTSAADAMRRKVQNGASV